MFAPPRFPVRPAFVALGGGLLFVSRFVWELGFRDGHLLAVMAWLGVVVVAFVVLWALGVAVPVAVWSARRGRHDALRELLRWIAGTLGFALLTTLACLAARREVDRRMERVVEAVQRFRAEHHRFPVRLEDLVPRYIDAVPQAWPLTDACPYFYRRRREVVALIRRNLDTEGRCIATGQREHDFLGNRWDDY